MKSIEAFILIKLCKNGYPFHMIKKEIKACDDTIKKYMNLYSPGGYQR